MHVAERLSTGDQLVRWVIEREAWPGREGWFLVHDVKSEEPAFLRVWSRNTANERVWERMAELLRHSDVATMPRLLDAADDYDRDLLFIAIEHFG